MIASFGSKVFQVSAEKVLTFSALSISGTLMTEKQNVEGKKPSTYIKGPDLETMDMALPLSTSLGVDIRDEYTSWTRIRDASKAYPFILGGRKLGGNTWLLKSVSMGDMEVDNRGGIRKAVLQLRFEEYVRAGIEEQAPGIGTDYSSEVSEKLFEPDTDLIRENPHIG